MEHPLRRFISRTGAPQGGGGFNAYAAGRKHYGGGRGNPNQGKTGALGTVGYHQRDVAQQARRDALIRRARG